MDDGARSSAVSDAWLVTAAELEDDLDDLRDRCARAVSSAGRFAVVGGIAAATLHGLWVPPGPIPRPEVVVVAAARPPRAVTAIQRRDLRPRRQMLRPDEIAIVDGVPVTTPARTWLGLSASLQLPDLVALGDSILHLGRSTKEDLERAVRRGGGRRGVVRARQALRLLDGRSRSRPESHLRVVLVLDGLPAPEVNVAIFDEHGGWLAEPDLVYREARLAIEYNGADHVKVRRMRNDISRTLDVEDGGWRQVTFGPRQVFGQPHRVVAHVQALLDMRDPGWRARERARCIAE